MIEGMAFTRPDDGSWTIMVAEERAVVAEEHIAQSDLLMTNALEILAKTAFKVHARSCNWERRIIGLATNGCLRSKNLVHPRE